MAGRAGRPGRRRGTALLPILVLTALGGCRGGGPQESVASPATGSTPSSGMAAEAADAYVRYVQAAGNAERRPPRLGDVIDPAADYTRHSFNPVRGQEALYLSYLVTNHLALRGTAPTPHPVVVSVRFRGDPYPTAILTDCLSTPPDWRRYDVRTGTPVPDPDATVPTQPTRIEVVYLQGHWGVRTIEPVPGRICAS